MCLKLAAPVVFLFLWSAAKGKDAEVVCVLKQSCVLPCSFQTGPNLLLHWMKGPHDTPVHSFYDNRSQLNYQNKNYTNRTSLFEELSSGNASLLLRKVDVDDVGKYKCYISIENKNEQNSYVNLRVHAPVLELSLQQEEEQLLCRAENIYPRPNVTWAFSPGPPTDPQTSIKPSETGLFSVNSSVPLIQRPLLEYSCNVSTNYSWRSATYRRNAPINSTGSEVTLRCAPSSASSIKDLIWTFNSTQTIVSRTGSQPVYSGTWAQSAELLDSGDLRLKDPAAEHLGIYSCRLRTDTGSYISHAEVQGTGAQTADHNIWIIVGCTGGVVLIPGIIMCWKRERIREFCSRQCNNADPVPPPAEQNPLNPLPPNNNGDQQHQREGRE